MSKMNTENIDDDSQFEEMTFGIQVYDNPADAWNNMSQEWGKNACDGETRLYVLNDADFEKVLYIRILETLCEKHFGTITDKESKKRLSINGNHNDYLLDFNYFHYSEKSGRYYTSRMEFKDDKVYMWSPHQWEIYDELMQIHDVKKLITEAKRFVKEHEDEIDEFGEDDYYEVFCMYDCIL